MTDWTESERERQAAVLAGKSVVANVHKGADEALVAWAKAEGRFVYIGRQMRGGWKAVRLGESLQARQARRPRRDHCRLSRSPGPFAGAETAAAGTARQGAGLLVPSGAVPRRRAVRGGERGY